MKRTINGKEIKITRIGRLYIGGALTRTMSDGVLCCDRITPLNMPDLQRVGPEIWAMCHDWAFAHYHLG